MKDAIRLHERTVPGAGLQIDGLAAGDLSSAHVLPQGTCLLDYRLREVIGEGGFGIVYLADCLSFDGQVAIKEYLPAVLTSRAAHSQQVLTKAPRHEEAFRAGLQSFIDEAQLLKHFHHPSLVRVIRCWQANGTAYMAMPYYEGPTLAAALEQLGHAPDEAQLRRWLTPLLDALQTLHAGDCLHRDIAPDNILLTRDGPLLLDFGAARRVIGEQASAPTVLLKRGYAPIEQYGNAPSMRQGPWTDLYALASVVYSAITGQPPLPAVERLMEDRLRPLSDIARGRYSAQFLAAIDKALAVSPSERPQGVAAFRALLDADAEESADTAHVPPDVVLQPEPTAPVATTALPDAPRHRRVPAGLLLAVLGLLAVLALWLRSGIADAPKAMAPKPAAVVAPEHPIQPAPMPAAEPELAETSKAEPAAPVKAPPAPAGLSLPQQLPAKRANARTASVAPPDAPAAVRGTCIEILQRASIEPLSSTQADFLKRECQ